MTTHKIIENYRYGLNQSNLYLKIERNGIDFIPGSCVSMFDRTYSIASGSNQHECLEFLIKLVPNGDASKRISQLKPADTIEIQDVFSYFTPGLNQTHHNYTYFATGTGIAPFRSALLSYDHRPHTVFWGGKMISECWDLLDIENINVKLAHSANQPAKLPARITDIKDNILLSPDHTYYLCGLDAMIDEISNFLIENQISYEQIQTEQFFQKSS